MQHEDNLLLVKTNILQNIFFRLGSTPLFCPYFGPIYFCGFSGGICGLV